MAENKIRLVTRVSGRLADLFDVYKVQLLDVQGIERPTEAQALRLLMIDGFRYNNFLRDPKRPGAEIAQDVRENLG